MYVCINTFECQIGKAIKMIYLFFQQPRIISSMPDMMPMANSFNPLININQEPGVVINTGINSIDNGLPSTYSEHISQPTNTESTRNMNSSIFDIPSDLDNNSSNESGDEVTQPTAKQSKINANFVCKIESDTNMDKLPTTSNNTNDKPPNNTDSDSDIISISDLIEDLNLDFNQLPITSCDVETHPADTQSNIDANLPYDLISAINMDFVNPANRTYMSAANSTRGTAYKIRKPRTVKRIIKAPSKSNIGKLLREAAKKENAAAGTQRPKKATSTITSSVQNFPNPNNWPACPFPMQNGTMPADEPNDLMPTVSPAAQNRPIQTIGKIIKPPVKRTYTKRANKTNNTNIPNKNSTGVIQSNGVAPTIRQGLVEPGGTNILMPWNRQIPMVSVAENPRVQTIDKIIVPPPKRTYKKRVNKTVNTNQSSESAVGDGAPSAPIQSIPKVRKPRGPGKKLLRWYPVRNLNRIYL